MATLRSIRVAATTASAPSRQAGLQGLQGGIRFFSNGGTSLLQHAYPRRIVGSALANFSYRSAVLCDQFFDYRVVSQSKFFSTSSSVVRDEKGMQRKPFSSTNFKSTKEPFLPFRHSRNRLPPICADKAERDKLCRQILEAPKGALFFYSFRDSKASLQPPPPPLSFVADDQRQAWLAADKVIQQVEYLIRGYAHTVEGTQWNRWFKRELTTEEKDEDALLQIMKLIDRMKVEGRFYMKARAKSMTQVYPDEIQDSEENVLGDIQEIEGDIKRDEDDDVGNKYIGELDEDIEDVDIEDTDVEIKDSDIESMHSLPSNNSFFLNDFALPGPSVNMYDYLLDTLACSLLNPNASMVFPWCVSFDEFGDDNDDETFDNKDNHQTMVPDAAFELLGEAINRHMLDGGDEHNPNPYTRPTVQTFNAAIRVAANLPFDYEFSDHSSFQELRDTALVLAFGAFDALSQTSIAERNSATYTYLLQIIAKFFPPSLSRGNIARGLWQHALLQGVVDVNVIAAMDAANTPSNGQLHDEYVDSIIRKSSSSEEYGVKKLLKGSKDLPHKWRRYNQVRRFHHREETY